MKPQGQSTSDRIRSRALLAGELVVSRAQSLETNFTLAGLIFDTSLDPHRWLPGLAMEGDASATHRDFADGTGLGALVERLIPGGDRAPFWNNLVTSPPPWSLHGVVQYREPARDDMPGYRGVYWPIEAVQIPAHRRLWLTALAHRAGVDPDAVLAALLRQE